MEGLQFLPFWEALTPEQQNRCLACMQTIHYKKGTLLHGDSEQCTGLFLILKGQLRVYTLTEEGREMTLYRLFERDMCLLSASCIFHGLQFDVMVSAAEDTFALHIPSNFYQSLMEESLPVTRYTNELMASHFSEVMWLMQQMLTQKLDTRLASLLLQEADLSQSDTIRLTHEQVAGHLGSAREVISRMLKHFQQEGMVTLARGSITLLDRPALVRLAKT